MKITSEIRSPLLLPFVQLPAWIMEQSYTIYFYFTPTKKLYIPSTRKTQMNLVHLCFGADWANMAVLKISAVLLKYPTFGVDFFHICMGKTNKKLKFLQIVLPFKVGG